MALVYIMTVLNQPIYTWGSNAVHTFHRSHLLMNMLCMDTIYTSGTVNWNVKCTCMGWTMVCTYDDPTSALGRVW